MESRVVLSLCLLAVAVAPEVAAEPATGKHSVFIVFLSVSVFSFVLRFGSMFFTFSVRLFQAFNKRENDHCGVSL